MKAVPVGECIWEIPMSEKPGMLVPARLYASERLLAQMDEVSASLEGSSA